jgi:hypothetical protein
MTLPISGPISLTDIQTEFGGTAPISLSEYYKGGAYVPAGGSAPNVPTSGPISLSNFYGARKLTLYTYTYTTSQSIVLPGSFTGNIIVSNMVGGGGGGGGGPDRFGSGYPGSPGRVVAGNVTGVAAGSTMIISIGGGGGGGYNAGGAGGGAGGESYPLSGSTLDLLSTPGDYRATNPNYCAFLNQFGVWNTASGSIFDQTISINFPYSGYYSITGSCDNYGAVYIDGALALSISGFGGADINSVYVTGGNHSVRLYGVNTGGPASIGVFISGSFSGGQGGNSGPAGSSGSGGGGGGATVLLAAGEIKAVAGGGGGGGGAGQYSSGIANNGVGGAGTTYGNNGQGNPGDGGGGGAGGGGYNGGAGGGLTGGDNGAYSGELGNSLVPLGGTQGPGSNGGAQNTAGGGGRITISYYA